MAISQTRHKRMLRTIRLDDTDDKKFPAAAENGEVAVPGGFVFTFGPDNPASLHGKQRRAFTNGFLGLSSFAHASLAVISVFWQADYDQALAALTAHLLEFYGAPSEAEAHQVAVAELSYSASLCDQPINTVLSLTRVITGDGIEERYSMHDSRPLWERDTQVFTPI